MTLIASGRKAAVVVCLFLVAAAAVLFTGLGEGENLLIQRQYKAAAAALEAALPQAGPQDRDRVLFLLGKAQLLAGDPAAAVAAFARLQQDESGSQLVASAAFEQAKALEKQGQLQQAAEIYRDRIAALIGLDRKEEVASTYLGLADKALGKEPPVYARAATFLDLALDLGLSDGKRRAVQLKAAECLLALAKAPEAIERLQPLIKELTPETGKLRAMLVLGRARMATGDRAGARTVLRDLRALSPDAAVSGDAAYEIALSYGVPSPGGDLDRAVGALRELQQKHPAHPKAKVALFLAAQCYRSVGRGDDALAALRQFVTEQGDSGLDEVAVARAMIGDVLQAQGKLEEAIAAWRDYLGKCPAHGEWERVQRAIVDTEYQIAWNDYAKGKDGFDGSRAKFASFAASYPLDERNPLILYLLGDMLRQEQKYDAARDAFARCVAKYKGKDASSQAQFNLGELYEKELFDYDKALAAYQEVTWGPWVGAARQRIGQLTRKSLLLATERVFRTDEAPAFELTSRNIDKVRVRVYRLDLLDYFRATHTASDVQRLDIEVIEPDQTFDSPVADYVRYRETKRTVPLPFKQPGAYVVKVDDRELEATTMVLVSDLAMTVKSSRHQLFVFTQNTKDERTAGGVKVVVSDGKKVLTEGLTGKDGTWSWQDKALQNLDDLRVFAVDASGSGAGTVDLSGLGYSQGMQPKGYLFTDRPLYQPGQRVNLKGIVREVQDGLYKLPAADGYRLQVFSAGGKLMLQRPVRFTAFGSFAAELDLPADAELGTWRVSLTLSGRDDQVHGQQFEVARYERPRLLLRADLDQSVVYRGDKISGRFVASYYFGEPAVGKEVRYLLRLPDGALVQGQGQTNAAGEVPFEFPTTEFAEEAMAVVFGQIVAENVQTQAAVPVVTSEFEPRVSTVRPVYLAGEKFDVKVEIKDRSGKPLAHDATAVLLRLEQRARGKNPNVQQEVLTVEVEVQRQPLRTAADGVASVALLAEKGGSYRVRVEAKDRFGNLVSGDTVVTISGDDDAVKLRLLGDRDQYRVGEQAVVRVINRAAAHLALLTVQGDAVLWHDARVIQSGESELKLDLQAMHAPNFALAVSMVDGKLLHLAERDFRVSRELQVEVKVPATAAPGSEVELQVTAKDPQGRPVVAEVTVAMVDQALLSLRPDSTPAISEFFYGELRQTTFRTVSSCTWSYQGRSQRVSEALLAEERREEREAGAPPPGGGARGPTTGGPAGPAGPATPGPANDPGLADLARNARGGGIAFDNFDRRQQQLGGGQSDQPGQQVQQLLELQSQLQRQGVEYHSLGTNGWQQGHAALYLGFAAGQPGVSVIDLNSFGQGTGQLSAARFAMLPLDQPRTDFSATGAWLSAVETAADGRGTAKVTMPDSTTSWQLKARAVTADSYVGEGDASLKTQLQLQTGLIGPPALTEGDAVDYGLRVHNLTDQPLGVATRLAIKQGAHQSAFDRSVDVAAHGEAEPDFHVEASAAVPYEFELQASAGALRDAMKTTVPVRPFGVEVRAGRAGSTGDKVAFLLSLAQGREYTALQLGVELGPDPGRDLVAAALGFGIQARNCMALAVTNLARSSRGLGALWALDYLDRSGGGSKVERDQLLALAQGMLAALLSSQRADGALAWIGQQNQDARSTAQALRFFAACRKRGMKTADAAADKAAEWLLQYLRTAPNEARADVLWALAGLDRARFESLNALHRARSGLDIDGLARLALAWQDQQRPELASEVFATLRPRLGADGKARVEALALAALALLRGEPRDALGAQLLERVRSARIGGGWETPEATAAAIAALAQAQGSGASTQQATTVLVTVNGRELANLGPESIGRTTQLLAPSPWLQPRDNKVEITVRGGGDVHYSASLVGFARGFTAADANDALVRIERVYLADALRFDNREVPRGFSVLQGSKYPTFENKLTQLRTGEIGRVRTSFWIRREEDRKVMTPLLVEEPLPAGCAVPRESITGSFDQVDVLPDRLVFYYREGQTAGTVEYQLQARFPGSYKVLPTKVQGALRPELIAYGKPGTLTVHARGKGESDPYRLTPDELYHLGSALFAAAQEEAGEARAKLLAQAGEHFDRLLADWQKTDFALRDDVFKQVARMQLFVAIERHDARAVVRFFEELKDRYPELVIPFDKILAVGRAYFDLGEFESALLVFRATADASFLKDAAVANTLEGLGEVKASAQFLLRLLLAYPDLPTMRQSRYSIGQKLAALAAAMDPSAVIDDRVGTAATLRTDALAAFREFLILYPEDPLAEEVSFAWATTCVEGKDLQQALTVAQAALLRYPQSPFTDELLYTVGYAEFVLGQHDHAFAALQRVATEEFPTPNGGKGPSESKWYAVYLQGQIHHARGEAKEALAAYQKVEGRFTDAGEAADYFLQKQLQLPEVATFTTQQSPELQLSYRNIDKLSLQVFKVDLMRLYLLEKSLNDIRGIQLNGIAPLRSLEVTLGDGRDYRQKEKKVALDLKQPGAYLVVARGGDLLATGMVLVSDLKLELQESADVGRLRVNVKQGDGFLADAHVKVIGSGDQKFQSGDTDLRGIYVADSLVGMATVIVKKDDQYAFFRGTDVHQPARYKAPAPQAANKMPVDLSKEREKQLLRKDAKKFDAFENNFNDNTLNRGRQVDWLKSQVLQNEQKGVEVQKAK